MSEPREVADRWLHAFNSHDEQALRAVTARDATMTAPPEIQLAGEQAITAYAMAWVRAFPDATIRVDHETAAGTTVVQEFTFQGTHRATLSTPSGEIPATERHLVGRGVQVTEVDTENGQVREMRLYFDEVQVLSQLGVMTSDAMSS